MIVHRADGGMAMNDGMTMSLLPAWLAAVWIVALAVVVVLHLRHAMRMHGQQRLWHVSHLLMAGGMIAMYALPQHGHADLYWGGVVLFGAVALAMLVVGARWWRAERMLNWLWLVSTVDMLVMMYMSLPGSMRDVVVTGVLIAYLVAETGMWLTNPVARLWPWCAGRLRNRPARHSTATVRPDSAGDRRTALIAARRDTDEAAARAATHETARIVADVTIGVRLTLAVMAVSMAWMFVAMQGM